MATQFAAEAKRMMPLATELPESKRKPGRPSERTQEIVDEICERLSNGETLAKICRDPKMPNFSTVWRWEMSDQQFSNVSLRAREVGTHFLADDCIRIADDDEIDPRHKHYMIDTRLRLIGKWNRKTYGDKQQIDANVSVSNQTPFDVRLLSEDQREMLRQLLEAATPKMIEGDYQEVRDE